MSLDPLYPPTLARRLSALLLREDMVTLIAKGHGYRDLNALVELALQVTSSEATTQAWTPPIA